MDFLHRRRLFFAFAAALSSTFSGHAQADPPTASFPLVEDRAPAPRAAAPAAPAAPQAAAPQDAVPSDWTTPSAAGPSDWTTPSAAGPTSTPMAGVVGRDVPPASTHRDVRDDWVVSIEAVTRAPVDIGFLAGLEVPGRVHVHAGYGWVPSPYVEWITGRIGGAAAADSAALGIIVNGFDSGHAWRVQAGVRPFRDLGVYFDAGYSRITLNGSVDTSFASSFAPVSADGAYSVETALDTWFLELGYVAHVGRHFLLGGGLGLMGTMGADTRVAANDARLPQADPQIIRDVNDSLERYGYLPTLSLRMGFDLY